MISMAKEYTAELTRTMKPETPVRTAPPEPERKEHLLSLKALLAGIVDVYKRQHL